MITTSPNAMFIRLDKTWWAISGQMANVECYGATNIGIMETIL